MGHIRSNRFRDGRSRLLSPLCGPVLSRVRFFWLHLLLPIEFLVHDLFRLAPQGSNLSAKEKSAMRLRETLCQRGEKCSGEKGACRM